MDLSMELYVKLKKIFANNTTTIIIIITVLQPWRLLEFWRTTDVLFFHPRQAIFWRVNLQQNYNYQLLVISQLHCTCNHRRRLCVAPWGSSPQHLGPRAHSAMSSPTICMLDSSHFSVLECVLLCHKNKNHDQLELCSRPTGGAYNTPANLLVDWWWGKPPLHTPSLGVSK